MKRLTLKEAYDVIKKYDRDLYNYYETNAEGFGCDAIRYAEYLLREHELIAKCKQLINEANEGDIK